MKLSEEQKIQIEEQVAQFPLFGYGYLPTAEVAFSERVRYICETECPQYGRSWSCPPAVGTVAECEARINGYDEIFVFASLSEGMRTIILTVVLSAAAALIRPIREEEAA